MRIVRELTSGDNPVVSRDDVREMSRDNAEGLVKLKKQGREITPELIEQAKTLPVYRFDAEVVRAQTLDLAGRASPRATEELEVEVQVRRTFYISGTTNSLLDKCIDVIMYLGEGMERDKDQTKDDYIIGSLAGDFWSAYGKDYVEMMKVRDAKAVHAATLTEDAIGPEPASDGTEDEEGDEEEEEDDDKGEDDEDEEEEGHVKAAGVEGYTYSFCSHIKGDGKRCQSPSLKDSEYCYYHKKYYAEAAKSEPAAAIQ
jgi:hypothetical protein